MPTKMKCTSLILWILYTSFLFAKTFGTIANVRHRTVTERKKPSKLKLRDMASPPPLPDEDNDEGVQDS